MKIVRLSLVLLVLLVAGCSEKEPIRIGLVATLTGEYSTVGISEMYGAELAVEEINKAGGINGRLVELVIKDDEADSQIAVKVDNELKDMGINIIVGHSLSIVALDAVDNANENGILLFSPSIGTDSLTDKDDMLIRNVSTTYYEGKSMAEGVFKFDPKKVLIIYNLDNYVLTQHHVSGVEKNFEERGFDNYLALGFESGNNEHISKIEEELATNQYDNVIIASSNIDAAIFINYIKVNNLDIHTHLGSWGATGVLPLIDTVDTSDIFGYFSFNENSTNPDYLVLKEQYESRYGEKIDMLSVNTYDILYILKDVIEMTDSLDPYVIKDKIIEIGSFEGSIGIIAINEYGDSPREHFMFMYEDGAAILVE